jgi:MFS family permease
MKKTVLTFGLIAGAIISCLMAVAMAFRKEIGFDRGEIVGYTSMVVAFLLIFFGVRAYRDNVAGGAVSFGRAFAVGGLIAVVASLCYVATWEVIYFKLAPTWGQEYRDYLISKARAEGKSEAEIAEKAAEIERFTALYRNPAFNAAVTFLEPMPVALVVVLVSAGVLSRRKSNQGANQGVRPLDRSVSRGLTP